METWHHILNAMTPLDYVGLAIFWGCWFGYRYFMEKGKRGRRGLIGVTHEYRLQWALESATRDIPVSCAALTTNLMNSVSFYASTTIYIIAGLFALVGAVDRLVEFAADLPFAGPGSKALLELKLILLIVVFVVAYFKFTWSIRQFNFLCILIGGVPHERYMPNEEYWQKTAERMARINSCAGNEFNRGIRAYYYGIAALTWFIHPIAFIASTLFITFIIYQRDYHSKALRIMRDIYPPEIRPIKYPPDLRV